MAATGVRMTFECLDQTDMLPEHRVEPQGHVVILIFETAHRQAKFVNILNGNLAPLELTKLENVGFKEQLIVTEDTKSDAVSLRAVTATVAHT